jgi:hypothetical protein
MKKLHYLTMFFLFFSVHAIAQPPAQGPPPPPLPGVPNSEVGIYIVIDEIKNTIGQMIQQANDSIAARANSTGIQAHLSFSYQVFKPGMSITTYNDRPNENLVTFPIMVEYTVSNIHYHGIPYFSRKIEQTIDISFRCKNWFNPPGRS